MVSVMLPPPMPTAAFHPAAGFPWSEGRSPRSTVPARTDPGSGGCTANPSTGFRELSPPPTARMPFANVAVTPVAATGAPSILEADRSVARRRGRRRWSRSYRHRTRRGGRATRSAAGRDDQQTRRGPQASEDIDTRGTHGHRSSMTYVRVRRLAPGRQDRRSGPHDRGTAALPRFAQTRGPNRHLVCGIDQEGKAIG